MTFVALLFKELRIAAFDPGLATSQGIHAGAMHYVLMIFVAAATVASFEAVGSILVIAMLIAPAAAARLLTDRLGSQVLCSLAIAVACGLVGYFGATLVPAAFGGGSVNAAGSMTVVAGVLVVAAALLSPSHGLIARAVRRRRLGNASMVDDLLVTLLRLREAGRTSGVGNELAGRAVALAARQGLVRRQEDRVELTATGLERATAVLRRHRLWEDYLVTDAGLSADHVHDPAEKLEHLTVEPVSEAVVDPHGKPIPPRAG